MANWGFGTWDAQKRDTNTGIVRILVAGTLEVANGQQSGSFSFQVPAGYRLDYTFQANMGASPSARRRVTISGNNFSISAAGDSDYSTGTLQAYAGTFLFFVRK
ncbi:hypothetical protein [Pantoea stewartii]|uniref:hypothetical protein n=1 Tax=Pantoea stewartii TaxID=66269 RepID=UPI00198101EC|nr:hypothetical protein [Pantoea stewartii]